MGSSRDLEHKAIKPKHFKECGSGIFEELCHGARENGVS